MADSSQYLRIVLDGSDYLLPSAASVAIEQRDSMALERTPGRVVAWRQSRSGRWPAYGFDAAFRPASPEHWQRAVFLETSRQPVGLVADDVNLLGGTDMHVAPFAPPGPAPTRYGHWFNAAWIDGTRVTLVIDPRALVQFLQSLGAVA
jgi:hypothetical protein